MLRVAHHPSAPALLMAGSSLTAAVRSRSSYAPPRRQMHAPAGNRNTKFVWQTHTANDTTRYDIDVREAHALLGTEPNDTLARVKLNYLLRCRMFHPEVGGNAAMFYKISLAYERIMFDRGVECRHGRMYHSDTLPPRPKFDTTPLLEDADGNVIERQIDEETRLLAENVELADNGDPVPWAKAAAEWRDDDGFTYKERQARVQGSEKAVVFIDRESAEAAQTLSLGSGSPAGAPAPVDSSTTSLVTRQTDSLLGPTDVTEVDAALLPDGGLVEIKKPKAALFNQQPLSKLSDTALMRRWATAGTKLTHDEEEATAREIIDRSINETGGALSNEQKHFMMMHLVERSDSVAGEAARAATDTMWNVNERRSIAREGMVLVSLLMTLISGLLVLYFSYKAYVREQKENAHQAEAINAETMLPWWGNDYEYERQVKRMFLEEWKRARSAARRVQTFTDGVNRESMPATDRLTLDVEIFDVTSQRLDELRRRVAKRSSGGETVLQPSGV